MRGSDWYFEAPARRGWRYFRFRAFWPDAMEACLPAGGLGAQNRELIVAQESTPIHERQWIGRLQRADHGSKACPEVLAGRAVARQGRSTRRCGESIVTRHLKYSIWR
jgi:hypothetical protein